MNEIWSKYIQGTKTLYYSRKMRFADMFFPQYQMLFDLDEKKKLRILEVGCGPGALTESLKRWYPESEVTGVDRDSEFIRFSGKQEAKIEFVEGDICALPFEDESFDVTISNTVSEHVAPDDFYSQQYRVLRRGGVCIVISVRKGIVQQAPCLVPSREENEFWERIAPYDDSMERYQVCRYPMNEAELPQAMEEHGFQNVRTGYAIVNLTPDDPRFSQQQARDMINSQRYTALEAIESAGRTLREHVSQEEMQRMTYLANKRYDERISLYEQGKKQWDTQVCVMMVIRGEKK